LTLPDGLVDGPPGVIGVSGISGPELPLAFGAPGTTGATLLDGFVGGTPGWIEVPGFGEEVGFGTSGLMGPTLTVGFVGGPGGFMEVPSLGTSGTIGPTLTVGFVGGPDGFTGVSGVGGKTVFFGGPPELVAFVGIALGGDPCFEVGLTLGGTGDTGGFIIGVDSTGLLGVTGFGFGLVVSG
jgi:hypothetical protein